MVNDLLRRAARKVQRLAGEREFNRIASRVLDTRPLELRGASPVFLSMVSHRDLHAYLLAIKSLYPTVGQGRVAIINERSIINEYSLTSEDMEILARHIPGVEIIDLAAIEMRTCPRGGTWERLVKIVELSVDNYVIQADADTLVSAPIPEIVRCWRENRSFLLGGASNQKVATAAAVARMVKGWIEENGWDYLPLCVAAEAALDRLPGAEQRAYAHASSGFAGFARGAFDVADLEWFSAEMIKLLGEKRWNEWGSEQISSNYMLANALGSVVLPYPKYATFEPGCKDADAAVFHYIGQYRFNDGVYARRAAEFIAAYASPGLLPRTA
jgi:hypothetical protein